jgi:xanthine dehydrogenase YagS FAD-binding subunit
MRPFTYARANDAAEAVKAGGTFLAGGTTLLDLMKLDVMRPARIVDINDLARELGAIEYGPQGLRLGALAHMAEAARHPDIAREFPVIAQSLTLAASAQLRNMATLGGNVLQRTRCTYFRDTSWSRCNKREPGSGCAARDGINRKHAVLGTSPNCIATYAGDFAQSLIALDASVELAGPSGARRMPFADLHVEPGDDPSVETVLRPGELITAFTVPALPFARRSLYLKIRDRQSYEFALASAAVALDLDGGLVREARIALGGVATRPWRARQAEAALRGKTLDESSARAAAEAAFAGAMTHGGNDYKPELGKRTLVRALLEAKALEI